LIYEKNRGRKSRETVSLRNQWIVSFTVFMYLQYLKASMLFNRVRQGFWPFWINLATIRLQTEPPPPRNSLFFCSFLPLGKTELNKSNLHNRHFALSSYVFKSLLCLSFPHSWLQIKMSLINWESHRVPKGRSSGSGPINRPTTTCLFAVLPGPEAASPLIEQKNYRYLAKTHRYFKFI
jgi:hypothetical protein